MKVAGELEARPADAAELFRDHYPSLKRLAGVLVNDADLAQDLAQDAFVRAWPKVETMDAPPAAIRAYMRTTLINLVRRSARRRVHELRYRTMRHETAVADVTDRVDIVQAVRILPPRQRACVALRYLEDLTEQETARALGISVGAVKSQTHRALRRLEQLLGEDE